jgi:hypothetical protein
MHSPARTSLLNDPRFVAETNKIDRAVAETRIAPTAPHVPESPKIPGEEVDPRPADAGDTRREEIVGISGVGGAAWKDEPSSADDYYAPLLTAADARRSLLVAAGLVAMMALGAAAALIVFYDRVAALLR